VATFEVAVKLIILKLTPIHDLNSEILLVKLITELVPIKLRLGEPVKYCVKFSVELCV